MKPTPDVSLIAPSLAGFCVTATRVARERDQGFSALRRGGLELVDEWYSDSRYEADHRVNGRGWLLSVEHTHLGPAEVVRQVTWRAEAHGLDLVVQVSFVDDPPDTVDVGTIDAVPGATLAAVGETPSQR